MIRGFKEPEPPGGPSPDVERSEDLGGGDDLAPRGARGGDASQPPGDGSGAGGERPRAVMVEQLSSTMRAAIEAGDLKAARIAHRALGELLESDGKPGAIVLDLSAERKKRGGR